MTFNKKYFLKACLLFLIELIIFLFFKDDFIRPILGDSLVVIFIYFLISSFSTLPFLKNLLIALAFCYSVETMQAINIIELFSINESKYTEATIGSVFDWRDMLAYTLGATSIYFIENKIRTRTS